MRLILLSFLAILSGLSTPLIAQINPQNITIARDKWGVPHIYGGTDAETAYGLAWANAEDNFEDMQQNLLMSRGRLGRELGKDGAILDYAVQLMQVRKMVEERFESDLSPAFHLILDGYVQAINTFAETHPDRVLQKQIFPIDGQDVIVGYVMSFALIQGVGAHIQNILQDHPGGPTPHSLRGSNGFAVNSLKTENGEVFLANNSHQPLDGPTAWYEAHIVSDEGLNTLGGLFPGGLSVFAGCNPNVSWMHTVNFPDFTDVYELEMNPKNKHQYKFDGEWKTLEKGKAKLRVKLGPIVLPLSKKTYQSVYGPTMKRKGKFYSLRFSALMDIRAAEQWHTMCKAQNFQQFYKAVSMQAFPGLNIVYADKNDTIWYLGNGLIPKRNPQYDWLGLVDGTTSETLWEEFHPIEELAQNLNPDCGYVFNTNQSPVISSGPDCQLDPATIDSTIGYFMVNNNRGIRYQELMEAEGEISWEKFKEIKFDQSYPDEVYVYNMPNIEEIFQLSPQEYPEIASGIEILKNWDRSTHKDSQGAALFLLSYNYLYKYARKKHILFERKDWPIYIYADAIDNASNHLMNHFGTLNVTLGELQRHVRGDKSWPVGGLPDIISAMYSVKWKKGRFRSFLGDSYIQLIRYTWDGKMEIETINPYGSSNVEGNPHYDDQAEMFTNQQLKKMTLDKDEIMRNAERIYHPGE